MGSATDSRGVTTMGWGSATDDSGGVTTLGGVSATDDCVGVTTAAPQFAQNLAVSVRGVPQFTQKRGMIGFSILSEHQLESSPPAVD